MPWSDEVCINRIQVARAQGSRLGASQAAKRRLLPAAFPQPNSGPGPIVLVASLLAASLYYTKEGHKLRGRKLHPVLESVRRFLNGGDRPARRSVPAGPARGAAPAAAPVQSRAAEDMRVRAAAAAEQRLRTQAEAQVPAGPAAPQADANKGSGGKKKGGGKGKGKKRR